MPKTVFTFPAGKRVTKVIAATAGNVVTNLTPGPGKRWLVLRGRITVVPDGTVLDRYLDFAVTDGTNVTEGLGSSPAIPATITHILSHGEGRVTVGAALGDNSYIGHDPVLVEGADQFRITLRSGVAGDSYSGYVVVMEIDV